MSGERKKRVAILGGAFDPVHNDHLRLSAETLNFDLADEVWFLPSPDRWDKSCVADAVHRVEMCRLALLDLLGVEVRASEVAAGEYRGSLVMLRRLANSFPDISFSLLVGSDTYPTIPSWRDPANFDGKNFNGEDLLREFSLILFPREGFPMPDPKNHAQKGYAPLLLFRSTAGWCVTEGTLSSTELRLRLRLQGESVVEGLLPANVLKYIRAGNLYGTKKR